MVKRFDLSQQVYAHRGLWGGDTPENSLAAFQAAARAGYGAECDVHLTSDGVPIVFHDFSLSRMTGATGTLAETTFTDLSELRLNGTDQTIPTLEEVVRAMQGLPLLIELKSGPETDKGALTGAITDLLSSCDAPCAVMSFDAVVIELLTTQIDLPHTGYLLDPSTPADSAHIREICRNSGANYLGPHVSRIEETARIATQLDMPLVCWTVRNEADLSLVTSFKAAPIFENMKLPLVRTGSIT